MSEGWTFDEINSAPLPEIFKQLEYWAENPPTHLLLKGFVGYKANKKASEISKRLEHQAANVPAIPRTEIPAFLRTAMEAASGG